MRNLPSGVEQGWSAHCLSRSQSKCGICQITFECTIFSVSVTVIARCGNYPWRLYMTTHRHELFRCQVHPPRLLLATRNGRGRRGTWNLAAPGGKKEKTQSAKIPQRNLAQPTPRLREGASKLRPRPHQNPVFKLVGNSRFRSAASAGKVGVAPIAWFSEY